MSGDTVEQIQFSFHRSESVNFYVGHIGKRAVIIRKEKLQVKLIVQVSRLGSVSDKYGRCVFDDGV